MCMNAAPSSQGLAMAIYTWKMNNEVVWSLCLPHHSCLREAPVNICKANWSSFSQNLPSFRCLQINSTAAVVCPETSVTPTSVTSCFVLLSFTLPNFPVPLGVDIVSLSCVFTPSTTKRVLIHDLGLWHSCYQKPHFQYTALMDHGQSPLPPAPREPTAHAAPWQWFWCIVFIHLKSNSTVESYLSHPAFIILYFIVK